MMGGKLPGDVLLNMEHERVRADCRLTQQDTNQVLLAGLSLSDLLWIKVVVCGDTGL